MATPLREVVSSSEAMTSRTERGSNCLSIRLAFFRALFGGGASVDDGVVPQTAVVCAAVAGVGESPLATESARVPCPLRSTTFDSVPNDYASTADRPGSLL